MVTKPVDQYLVQAARQAWLDAGDERLLPLVDAHHHYWDPVRNPHPWLQRRPRIAFRYGDYEPICREFLPPHYDEAARDHLVVGHVTMEGEWDPADPSGEARWISALAAATGEPQAHAAQVWLDREDLAAVLAVYRALPLVRSVRHKPATLARAAHHEHFAAPGSMRCPRWRDGYARLAPAGLMFELQVPWWHFGEALELARDFPATTIVVNHAGLPAERDAASLAAWRRALALLADCANVVVKLSGIGVPGRRWTPELQRPVLDTLIDAFGTGRCLFASNFPVDGLCASFDEIASTFKVLTRRFTPAERLALACDNALRLYRLFPPCSPPQEALA
ncbi:thioesterase [Rubrivivax gelatinosus]|uniref:amidohydrolase family protein n=1 Tax=Rubrivivax gelatinosus TaxID=28068 RepID=UPI001903323C|nr:amidohydrolase family protein [Rubrivivax gelatinosus]MBK1613922.1 thioesterase [Rubrivivax gelatinosus]